ncbi:MAG: hypothetical protein A3F31_04110 [Candidatus Levybacteria bacterium RIFCSPHIGHO2_12_FULL_38_12]|nr:MAG: hypothetical protein A3F31_04110 [Candidatus Levybacteria bacterium RIFCSPHIGHO2_12_FULL_38_12]OGH34425.1 MAG: hypothetical protein A3A47_04505 [Candidatus Levybacteria bacterium RIFCSPLOWO2_01_FULL_37_20]OGH44445.1 MAG: hypothetical protein A3J14_03205 [Candidatus Levybacteria bacterium RIFCSPLOWO2_02_FULL_37_18]
MIFLGKYKILNSYVSACDYEFILANLEKSIRTKKNFLVSPIASQTLVVALLNKKLREVLNKFDYIAPDGQWVRWSLFFLYGVLLKDRVYGPQLMLDVCRLAEKRSYRIFLYGSSKETLQKLENNLTDLFPKIKIVGRLYTRSTELNKNEQKEIVDYLDRTKTDIVFVGLGSPRQEFFTYKMLYQEPSFKKTKVIIPVGAAFDFISKVKRQAPQWMQNKGLEWLFRLMCEPGRLWKRYMLYGTLFVVLIFYQKFLMLFNFSNNKIFKSKIGG